MTNKSQIVQTRIEDAIEVIKLLGLPKGQWNSRTAMVLLALGQLPPDKPWSEMSNALSGTLAIMGFIASHYETTYAPNTRETIRRYSLHQMVDAGIVLQNPDEPTRPTNSAKTVYQLTTVALETLRTRDTSLWSSSLEMYLKEIPTLRERYAQSRDMQTLPVSLADGTQLRLSPGGQNVLVKDILEQFAPRFVKGGIISYVGDTSITDSGMRMNADGLATLEISQDYHGKMPDVILFDVNRGWLILVEAVTSHGPVNVKRRDDLHTLFSHLDVGIVYVTAFLSRKDMIKHLADIAWETEVWIAESPDHLIHFDGDRFLGPYDELNANTSL